jgi:antitoxin HicB
LKYGDEFKNTNTFVVISIKYLTLNMSLSYKVLLKPEPEGGYTVNVPALPGCITYGETLEEAKTNAREAIELYIESLKAHGEEIPTDADVLEYNLQLSA